MVKTTSKRIVCIVSAFVMAATGLCVPMSDMGAEIGITASAAGASKTPMSKVSVKLDESSYTYKGTAYTPAPTVKYGKKVLKKGKDYTVSYKNNLKVGTASVVVTGKGDYSGTKTSTFKITKLDLNKCSIEFSSGKFVYTFVNGTPIKPAINVKYGTYMLSKDKQYTVSYSNYDKVGTATVTIKATGNDVKGAKSVPYELSKSGSDALDIKKCSLTLDKKIYDYTGHEIKPNVVVKFGDNKLALNSDYTIAYKNNVNVGTAKETPINTNQISVTVEGKNVYQETGKAITPNIIVSCDNKTLKKDTDYSVTYKNNVKAGTATILVTGKGNYSGSVSVNFQIEKKPAASTSKINISSSTLKLDKTTYSYTGKNITPNVTVKYKGKKLKQGTNYTITYKNNKKVGTAKIIVAGKGEYNGQKEISFKIEKAKLTSKNIVTKISNHTPSVTVKYNGKELKKGTDYTAKLTTSYSDSKGVRNYNYVYKITGIGSYTGTLSSATIKDSKFLTSKDKPGLIHVGNGTKAKAGTELEGTVCTVVGDSQKKKLVRPGWYTGWQIDKNHFYIKARYGTLKVAKSNCSEVIVSSKANSITLVGTISQLEPNAPQISPKWGSKRYWMGCGPTAVTMLINSQLNLNKNKNDVTEGVRNDSKVAKYATGLWGYTAGTPFNGVQAILNKYIAIAKNSFKKSELAKITNANKAVEKIDDNLSKGRASIVCVQQKHTYKSNSTSHDYSQGSTHYIVIAAETGGKNGSYYVADPFYMENKTADKYNGKKEYYYGLVKVKKSTIASSMIKAYKADGYKTGNILSLKK